MRIYSTYKRNAKNAGPKAPEDIIEILSKKYKAKNMVVYKDKMFILKIILNMISSNFSNDYVIYQHPLIHKKFILYNLMRRKKSIVLIHDLIGLRNNDNKLLKYELKALDRFKSIVVHNNSMKNVLLKNGINENKIYVLELFDYLANGSISKEHNFNKENLSVLYPGNLAKEKSPFIYQLDYNKIDYKLDLYGIGIENNLSSKIKYNGSFKPSEINDLKGDIGLIWDGNFDDSDENEKYKRYTLFNNPHKLSCCMALGIPVVVWEKAAIAEFVRKYNVGYLINNLYEINKLNFDDYNIKRENAYEIGKKVRSGFYTQRIISQIIGQEGRKYEKNK